MLTMSDCLGFLNFAVPDVESVPARFLFSCFATGCGMTSSSSNHARASSSLLCRLQLQPKQSHGEQLPLQVVLTSCLSETKPVLRPNQLTLLTSSSSSWSDGGDSNHLLEVL